MLRVN